jgi:hypothetical protein
VFLFLLSLVMAAGNYLLSANAVRRAAASAATVAALCHLDNQTRARQVQLWAHLIASVPPPRRETAAARARREETARVFLAYVRQAFAQRNCGDVTSPGK